ncbi:hypothetical protein [Silvimonas sp.]|uniref:hypothetical protein n=1 Tax=Silvimonas sp. TaxID=2650811 RepID=UPI0028496A7A|nr:hypothetical protein [Silvimonas sp.]MDR3427733.1 hypothetical protein [Silvimonas sp.]
MAKIAQYISADWLTENWKSLKEIYGSPEWLIPPFDSVIWILNFGEKTTPTTKEVQTQQSKKLPQLIPPGSNDLIFSISWDILLDDNRSLIDPIHHTLLEFFRYFLSTQNHPDYSEYQNQVAEVKKEKVGVGIRIIDYFLVRKYEFELARYGLSRITEEQVIEMFRTLSDHARSDESIYKWREKLTAFLIESSKCISTEYCSMAAVKYNINFSESVEKRTLPLTELELTKAKIYLFENGYYGKGNSKHRTRFKYTLNVSKISAQIYRDTLRGHAVRTPFAELNLCPDHGYRREYPSIPVRDDGKENRSSAQSLSRFAQSFQCFEILSHYPCGLSKRTLDITQEQGLVTSLQTRTIGHYHTLRFDTVFVGIKKAIEFYLSHGDAILNSYANLLIQSHLKNQNLFKYCSEHGVDQFVENSILKLGVKYVNLVNQLTNVEFNVLAGSPRATRQEFFKRLRNHEALFELVEVLYGAIQFVFGATVARRQAEILRITPDSLVQINEGQLAFTAGKSGFGKNRQSIARPMPLIVQKMMKSLLNFQSLLVRNGCIEKPGPIFASPGKYGGFRVDQEAYNSLLDRFADYCEFPLDSDGRRSYAREHQLRRFFALAFFWSSEIKNLDALRWFLGQNNPAHVWNYIMEVTPGHLLISAKSEYVATFIGEASGRYRELTELIQFRFGLTDFRILTEPELEDYIYTLQLERRIKIVPQFASDGSNQFKVAVLILEE